MTENPKYDENTQYKGEIDDLIQPRRGLQKKGGEKYFSAYIFSSGSWVKIAEDVFSNFDVVHELITGKELNYDTTAGGYYYTDEQKPVEL